MKGCGNELYSTKGLCLVQIGRRICAQVSILSVKSVIAFKISESPHYSEVRKYKMWEQTLCFTAPYDRANIEDSVQESMCGF